MQKSSNDIPGWVLFDEEQIEGRVGEMGYDIRQAIEDGWEDPKVIIVLKGAAFFGVDLMRDIGLPLEFGFMEIDSYGAGTTTSGKPKIHMDPKCDVRGRNVQIVEDIVDSGLSMKNATEFVLVERGAASVRVATFLDKPAARKIDFRPDYTGFSIDPHFVIGYGLDFNQKYRQAPTVNVLPPFRGVQEKKPAWNGAEHCLILGDAVRPEHQEDLMRLAYDFKAIVRQNGFVRFFVARSDDGPQVLMDERELAEMLGGARVPA